MPWRDGSVDQNNVPRVDAGLPHGIACHPHQERGLCVLDKDVIEVESCDAGVVCRRTKTDGNACTRRRLAKRGVAAETNNAIRETTGHTSSISMPVAQASGIRRQGVDRQRPSISAVDPQPPFAPSRGLTAKATFGCAATFDMSGPAEGESDLEWKWLGVAAFTRFCLSGASHALQSSRRRPPSRARLLPS